MKKFSLKKITAAVSAAAMIATMGTSAFAASPVSAGQDGDGITITDVTVTQRESGSKLYDVSVTYTTSVAQEIGTTMLTYVKHGNSLTSVEAYNDSTMKIVGVDQKNDMEAFTFTVTTEENSNGIYMTPGEAGLLMLSGDKVTTPAVASVKIPAPAAVKATADAVDVDVYSYEDAEAIKSKIVTKLTGKTANIFGTAEGAADATYTFTGTETAVLAPVADQTGKYTYTVTIPEGATLSNTTVSIPANFTCAVEVTANTVAWTANTIELNGGNTVSLTKGDVTGDINDAVKAALIAKGFVIKDAENHSAPVTNASSDGVITVESTGVAYVADSSEDQTLTYKVTVTNAESKQGDVTVATLASGEITDIAVTVAALDAEFIVATAEGTKGGAAVSSVTVPNGTSEADAKVALTAAIDNITVKNATGDKTESGWTTSGEWSIAGYDATNESAATYTATIAIAEPTERGTDKGVNKDSIKLTLTLNVEAKPVGVLGDVDGSGEVDSVDAPMALNIYLGVLANPTEYQMWAANVNKDSDVDLVDASMILNYYLGVITSFE